MSNPSWKDQLTLNITDTDVCGRDAKFVLPAEASKDLFLTAAKGVARKAQIPGFRPGKAPIAMVKARYKGYIDEEAGRLVQVAAYDLLSKKADELDIISYSKLEPAGTLEEGKEFTMKCDFEIAPEFELPDYKSLGEVAVAEDAAKIEEDLIERAKAQYSSFTPITDAAREGDMLHVSYESDFALPEDASDSLKRAVKNDSAWIYLIGQEMIPGVNAALTGATIGGEYTFTADYPADWREEGLRGKKVTYKMKVHDGQRREPIEDMAKLAEKMEFKSADELTKFYHDLATRQAEIMTRSKTMESIQAAILEKAPQFDLPTKSLETATDNEYKLLEYAVGQDKDALEKFNAEKDQHMEEAKTKATEQLRKNFIMRKIARKEDVKLTDQEIGQAIQNMAQQTRMEPARLAEILQRTGRLNELEIELLVEKTLGVLAERRMKAASAK
jgi:trigger factor